MCAVNQYTKSVVLKDLCAGMWPCGRHEKVEGEIFINDEGSEGRKA